MINVTNIFDFVPDYFGLREHFTQMGSTVAICANGHAERHFSGT
jgi:hypothetical protein